MMMSLMLARSITTMKITLNSDYNDDDDDVDDDDDDYDYDYD